jgi:MFS family permease
VTADPKPSYRALLAVPSLGRVLLGMQIARISQSMVGIVSVLFALQRYNSPQLAGAVAFASIVPGLIVSPVAGALLDRHGRVRLIVLDYLVASLALALVAGLAWTGNLPWWLLLAIVGFAAVTGPLSSSGLRSLFPMIVPEPLWERVNALDSNGWLLATIVGAPVGAVVAQVIGFEPALAMIGAGYLAATFVMLGSPDPRFDVASTGNIWRDAWLGLVYTWNNRTLRGLAISLSTMNLAGGVIEIAVPMMILHRLGLAQAWVGYMFGLMGAFGVVSAFLAGRIRTLGRERQMIVAASFGFGISTTILLWPAGLLAIAVAMALGGLVNGPLDIAMFTLRQRRTDPAWMGRAFTVSMNLNFAGYPIGAAVAGVLVGFSIEAALIFGVVANFLGVVLAWLLIPRSEEPAARWLRAPAG